MWCDSPGWPRPAQCWGFMIMHNYTHAHTHTHTHPVRLLWTSYQLVAEAATYTTHTQKTNIRALRGIRTREPAIKRLQTCALDRLAIGFGCQPHMSCKWWVFSPYLLVTLFFLTFLYYIHSKQTARGGLTDMDAFWMIIDLYFVSLI